MTGFLVLAAALGQWNIIVLDTAGPLYSEALLLRDGRWPVVVGNKKVYRYEGTWPWTVKNLPSDTSVWLEDFTMDREGLIHISAIDGYSSQLVREYVETSYGWYAYNYTDPYLIAVDGQPFLSILTRADTSIMFYEVNRPTPPYQAMVQLSRVGKLWKREEIIPGTAFSPDAQVDSSGNLWVFYHKAYSAWCAHQVSGSWIHELVEDIGTTCWYNSGPFLTIRGTAFALYRATGALKDGDDTLRFAWRRADGTWYYEKMREFGARALGVDSSGLVHAATTLAMDSLFYHVVRDTSGPGWDTLEVIDIGPASGLLFVDADGYLHATYVNKNGLFYATTRPDVRVSEAPPEPKPDLILIPTNHGFYISGHSGEVEIYDPAGRLVLSKEINGKTLISPLRPGVYFVMAGKERARVAVR